MVVDEVMMIVFGMARGAVGSRSEILGVRIEQY